MLQDQTIKLLLNCGIAIDVERPVVQGESGNARESVEMNSVMIFIPKMVLLVESYRAQFGKYVQEIFGVL